MKKKINWQKVIGYFVLITLISTAIFLIFVIKDAPTVADPAEPFVRLKSDYALMLSQCILGIVAMMMPTLLENKFKIIIPSYMIILYTIFLYAAIYLGEVKSFYYNISNWDNILHTFSMQKFALENGTPLIGRAALADTMMDLVVDAVGAFIMSVIGYISLKYNKGWIERLQVKMTK